MDRTLMGLTERIPGFEALRRRLAPMLPAGGEIAAAETPPAGVPVDIPALIARVEEAGPDGSAYRLIAIVALYEYLAREVDPARWHAIPGLRQFVRETGQYIPNVPAPVLARARESADSMPRPRAFLPAWVDDGGRVAPVSLAPADLFATIEADRERAEAFVARHQGDPSELFVRYAQWHHSLATARALGAERVIGFGGSSREFCEFFLRQRPDTEVCVVDPSYGDGLSETAPGLFRLGAALGDLGLFDDESVDLVIAHNSFERLLGDDDKWALSEIERVLVRGGRFVITPFMVSDQHALMVSPFSCFVANRGIDYGAAIEAEMVRENALLDVNYAVVTPVSRRYELASAKRRLLESAPQMSARLRPFSLDGDGFTDAGVFADTLFGLVLKQSLFEDRAYLSLEFIKH